MRELGSLFQHIRNGTESAELESQFPFYPLDAPGMPLPGKDFIAAAVAMGDLPPVIEGKGETKRVVSYGANLHYLYRRALYDDEFELPVNVKGHMVQAPFVPGHKLGYDAKDFNGGPRHAKVFLLGKFPGFEEVNRKANFVGDTSDCLWEALDTLGIGQDERAEWYVTNLVKWPQLDRQSDSLPVGWKQDCAILLEQELRLVRPDYILCLGSDASKFLLGTSYGVDSMVGRVIPYTIPLFARGEEPAYHQAKVMAVMHPAFVYRRMEAFDQFKDQLGSFYQLTQGVDVGVREVNVKHVNVYKHAQLKRIVDEIRADPDPLRSIVAIDCEWEGKYPTDEGAYLRTVQFSTRYGEAYCVVLRYQGGEPAFVPSLEHARHELRRLLLPDPAALWHPRVGGHFLRSDAPWLIHEGVDFRPSYAPPPDMRDMRDLGGWETGLAYHAVNETASYDLSDMTVRLTTASRYDEPLMKWRTAECKSRNISTKELEGYGKCPAWVMHPEWYDENPHYACYDADVARRIIIRCMQPGGLLDHDMYGQNSWEPYWVAHRASLGFLEMEMNGVAVDKARMDELVATFGSVRDRLLANFRQAIHWGTFNPRSHQQVCAFLFGDRWRYKHDKLGALIPIVPEGATVLNLQPIKTTGKRSKLWSDVVMRREDQWFSPSTDKEVLGILGHEHTLAMQLRDLKFISQVLTGALRDPLETVDGDVSRDEEGYMEYAKGLAACIHDDGRIRTHLQQTKETGRASSSRPPLQNISKRREDDYARILGTWYTNAHGVDEPKGDYLDIFDHPLYEHPIRSIFCASPGHVLVEADFKGAELAVLAWMSGDPVMIDHVRRNELPESHPDHYDIHARQAVNAFQLPCAPTKSAMKKAGFKAQRVAAKNVNFGVPYGRAAEAIARQCREENADVSSAEAQQLIDAYFAMYQCVGAFLAECRARSQDPHWLVTCWNRRRRFIGSKDKKVIGEQQRQAQNSPIQGSVADAISRAIDNLLLYRLEQEAMHYRLLLQMHDALLFEVPIPELKTFAHSELDAQGNIVRPSVLQMCMCDRVPVWPRRLDGTLMPVPTPYHFGIDVEVALNWGESITTEQCQRLGIDPTLV